MLNGDLVFHGKLLAIGIASAESLPLSSVDSIAAMAGRGLTGDRYAEGKGVGQKGPAKPDQEVTLIEQEAIAAAGQRRNCLESRTETRFRCRDSRRKMNWETAVTIPLSAWLELACYPAGLTYITRLRRLKNLNY